MSGTAIRTTVHRMFDEAVPMIPPSSHTARVVGLRTDLSR